MHLPVLAFFTRAIRGETRSIMTYGIRSFLVAVLTFVLMSSQLSFGSTNAPGLGFLKLLIAADLIVVGLVGIAYFSSVITEEKEEMTLGLLRMAGLSPVSILLGKSTSRLIFALMLLLVEVPFAALAVTLGGVAMNQVTASYAVVLAFVIFLCNVALLCSVLCQRGRSAGAATFALLALFLFVPHLLQTAHDELIGNSMMNASGTWALMMSAVADALFVVHPFERLEDIFRTGYTGGWWSSQISGSCVWALVFFVLSWLLFNVRSRDQKQAAASRGFLPRRTAILRSFGAGRAWANALPWKDFYFVAGGKGKMLAKTIVFVVTLLMFGGIIYLAQRYDGRLSPDLSEIMNICGIAGFWVVLVVSVLEMAGYASRIFKTEVQWKTLSSLATLPHSMAHIARAKVKGCLPVMIPNLIFAIITIALMGEFRDEVWEEVRFEPMFVLAVFYGCTQFALFLCLTAFLSLVVKWGAFPLALILHFMVQQVSMSLLFLVPMLMMSGRMEAELVFFLLSLLTLGLAVVFAKLTIVRLDRAAGETA